MFKITPIQDKSRQSEVCLACGVEFKPEAFAYQMFDIDTEKIMGIAQFEIGEHGYIYDLRPALNIDDFEAMFILGRQTMNFIDKCGAHKCKAYFSTADVKLLTSIGFKSDDGINYFCDMTNMFDGHCDK